MAKIRNFDSFGAMFPHFCPDKREIWHGVALPRAILTFIGVRVAPAGRKSHCWTTA